MIRNVKLVRIISISLKILKIALKNHLKDIISMKKKKNIQNVMINAKHALKKIMEIFKIA